MHNRILSLIKPLALSVLAFAFLTIGQAEARADEVTLSGSTTGTVTGVPQLTFAGNNFTGTTSLGFGSLSGRNNLGTFFLSTAPTQAVSGSFTLNITFSMPVGITGGQNTTYTAVITGTVSPNQDQGGVIVRFNNPTQTFTFNDGTNSGSFTLTLDHTSVQSGRSAEITAHFTGNQVAIPEPATMILLGTGLTGVAAAARKRRRASRK